MVVFCFKLAANCVCFELGIATTRIELPVLSRGNRNSPPVSLQVGSRPSARPNTIVRSTRQQPNSTPIMNASHWWTSHSNTKRPTRSADDVWPRLSWAVFHVSIMSPKHRPVAYRFCFTRVDLRTIVWPTRPNTQEKLLTSLHVAT